MGKALDEYIADRQTAAAQPEETPETPETPAVPETPKVPETPETPEVPETPETPEVPETPETPAEEDLNDEQLNTFFDTTGKTKEEIKNDFALGSKYGELEGKYDGVAEELETLKLQNAELKRGLDPLTHFSSQENYVAEQLRIKYPNMDALAIQRAVTKDLSKMNDLDLLALQDTIKYPGVSGGESMAKKVLADQYGVDPSEPTEQWDELARAKVQRAAIIAREELGGFSKEIELPAIKSEDDLKAERATAAADLKERWGPALSKMSADFDKITIPGKEGEAAFDFEVPQSFRDGLGDYFDSVITNGELEPGEEAVKLLMEQRNKDFLYQNIETILATHKAAVLAAATEQTDKDLNNTTPANTQTKPGEETTKSGFETHVGNFPGRISRT